MSERTHPEIQVLRGQVAQLSHRVEDLELHLGLATAPPPPVPEPVVVTPPPPVVPVTPPPPPRPVPAPELTLPPVKHDPLVPAVDWAALAERLFTARTLAWAGGAATALGVILLFVMAASRGWVTPEMKVGLGLLVSLGLLGGAIELDRRKLRADSILAAAGAGIAGLYATLWAATSLYGFFGDAVALPLAAVVAALAVAVAIRVKQQPLAVFGVGAAMLAPVLVDPPRHRRRRAVCSHHGRCRPGHLLAGALGVPARRCMADRRGPGACPAGGVPVTTPVRVPPCWASSSLPR